MARILEYWVIKTKDGKEDPSWRAQGPYISRKAARKYRDAMINTALRLKELGEGENYSLKEKEVANDDSGISR